jgi:stage V sporulation protein K
MFLLRKIRDLRRQEGTGIPSFQENNLNTLWTPAGLHPVSSKETGSTVSTPAANKPTVGSVPHVGHEESPLGKLLAELHSHIGLASVKKDIEELANSIRFDRKRQARGLRIADRSLHMVFYGNPGTGKTTVARLVAQIYKELGVLTKGHLVSTDRAGLVANYVGQTATKVTAVVQEAIGGVLFIDEAYSLAPPGSQNDFGQEAIQQLLLRMENHRKELVVIVAGYPEEMERFLDTNPGLSSRFTKKLHFEDYSPDELLQIFEKMCRENDYRLHERARDKLLRFVQVAYNHRDKTFGNARFSRNLFEEATKNLANRVLGYDLSNRAALMVITEDDIPDQPVSIGLSSPSRQFPDLGKYLASKGWPQKSAFVYTSWNLDDLAIVRRGHYCTTVVQPMDGNLYCGTFDFGGEILEQILAYASASTRAMITSSLAEDPESVRHLRLPNPINVGIAATLGSLQQGLHETFIPLVIIEVIGAAENEKESG